MTTQIITFENHFELVLKLSHKDQNLINITKPNSYSHLSWNMILKLDSFDFGLDDLIFNESVF
jgi:hypothetical protein